MAATEVIKNRKRKAKLDEEPQLTSFPPGVGLEMLSEEELEDEGLASDDGGAVDEFPEIDARSDSDSGGEEESDHEDEQDGEESEEEEEDEDESQESDSDGDLHIFPKSKTIISGITGQPIRVYPEIEPDYDSDSSTEDV